MPVADPAGTARAAGVVTARGPWAGTRRAVRCDLPQAPATFVGRRAELAGLAAAAAGEGAAASAVNVIVGMPGCGKTALALRCARLLAARYPDARLFLDLHGRSCERPPLRPYEALGRLLRAIGVPAGLVPPDQDERAALWRAELSGRRVLVVLDDAAGARQVRALVPAGLGCRVLITSRQRLAGLDATTTTALGVLEAREAAALFLRLADRHRIGAPDGVGGRDDAGPAGALVTELVELCGRLPFAVRVAAELFGNHPSWTVADLLAVLRDERRRMTELRAGDRDLDALFAPSYAPLPPAERIVLRALAAGPAGECTLADATVRAGLPREAVREGLSRLFDRSLVEETAAGRYRLHPLLRDYVRLAPKEPHRAPASAPARAATIRP